MTIFIGIIVAFTTADARDATLLTITVVNSAAWRRMVVQGCEKLGSRLRVGTLRVILKI